MPTIYVRMLEREPNPLPNPLGLRELSLASRLNSASNPLLDKLISAGSTPISRSAPSFEDWKSLRQQVRECLNGLEEACDSKLDVFFSGPYACRWGETRYEVDQVRIRCGSLWAVVNPGCQGLTLCPDGPVANLAWKTGKSPSEVTTYLIPQFSHEALIGLARRLPLSGEAPLSRANADLRRSGPHIPSALGEELRRADNSTAAYLEFLGNNHLMSAFDRVLSDRERSVEQVDLISIRPGPYGFEFRHRVTLSDNAQKELRSLVHYALDPLGQVHVRIAFPTQVYAFVKKS